jgi:hypothetical protein
MWVNLIQKVDLLGLIFQNYLNICKPKFMRPLMNNTFELFNFNVCESFLHYLIFELTEFDLSKIKWLCGIIQLHPHNVGALRQVFIMSHSYQISFSFLGSDLNLNCRLRDHKLTRFTSVGIRARR